MKKGLSLLLALLMLFSCVPNIAFGIDETEVYISVAENGGFVKDKNGDFVANRKITVSNETPTLNDVFIELHNRHYEGGADAGYETTESGWGAMITKFFGKESSYAGYRNNHLYAMGATDSVEDGAYIVFFFYQDTVGWSDSYVKFDKKDVTADGGEKIELILTDDNNEPVKNAVITVDGEKINKITDEYGKAELYFSDAGRYIISAESEFGKLVPPVCTVEITNSFEDKESVVKADADALNIDLIAEENIKLPTVGSSGVTSIVWISSDDKVITNSGEVKRGAQDAKVTLTAEISLGDYLERKEFIVTVPLEENKFEENFRETLLANIAKTYSSFSDEWKLMDMMAYEKLYPESENKTTDKAKQDYINTVIPKIINASDETTLSKAIMILTAIGTDSEILYPVNSNNSISAVEKLISIEENSLSAWVAPYVVIALSQKNYDADEKINSIISGILANQNEDGSWTEYGESIQTTANMIACLSLYYESNEEVKTALNKAVGFLSSAQKEDGTYDAYGYGDDTNTVAMIVIALSSLGINSDTDSRFIKNGISVYETLFKYMLDDFSGFGYNATDLTYNDYSTEQAFRAIISAVNVEKNEKAYNVYDFSENELTPGRAIGNGNSSGPSVPDTDDTVNVKISIKGKSSYWLNSKLLTLKKGSTIYHALVEACNESGITCEGVEDGYVYKMSNGEETLVEFGEGADSGWLYKVNGNVLNIGILEYELNDGDKIVWFYTEDWHNSTGFSSENINNENKITSLDLISKINEISEITLRNEALINELLDYYNSLSEEDKKKVANYNMLIKAKEKLEEIKTAYANISFKDTSSHWAEESILYIAKNGYMAGTEDNKFSPDEELSRGMLVTVLYRIAGEPKLKEDIKNPYNDVESDSYYYNAVSWANKENIINGIERSTFSPELNITREEFITMLYRYTDSELELYDLREYKDADNVSDWAVNSLKWAVKKGIIKGKAEALLAPKDNITRGEAAVIIERFLKNSLK